MGKISKESAVSLAIKYAFSFVGIPYKWGGNNPLCGFDCSGFVCEVLKPTEIIGRNEDLTASDLYERFKNNKVETPYTGCLVFYGTKVDINRIVHIELCLDEVNTIGAIGGGSKTLTKEDAIRDNAFVKIRTWESRGNVKAFVDPFK